MWKVIGIAGLAAALASTASAQEETQLSAPLIGVGGTPVGVLELRDTPNGVLVSLTIEEGALPAGVHAIHFHEKGDCSNTETFETAGGHHNPTGAEHGYLEEGGPHAGDLPNFNIAETGTTAMSAFNPMVRFTEGDAPLLDADGSSVVIHAGPDDYQSQPSGDSGDRIACAELTGG
jgi:superoxide dismutase, Cu-Zn family